MKKQLYGFVLFTSIILASCSQSRNIQGSYPDESSDFYETTNAITYEDFYDDLSPYGQWIDNPDYGRVWYPRENGFRPYYTNGHWAYTNYGWTWVSNYNWGWATFHYGRWFHDNAYGWMWVPGYEWAPAWVSWRQSSDYYGWAPLYPRGRNGHFYEPQYDQWAFVPHQYINRNDLNNYYINNQNNTTIINNTTVINNPRKIRNGSQYQEGPRVAEVEKVTNQKIRVFPVKQSTVPGNTKLQDGALHVYNPVIKRNNINKNDESNATPAGSAMPSNKVRVPNGGLKPVRSNSRIKPQVKNENSSPDNYDQTQPGGDAMQNSSVTPESKTTLNTSENRRRQFKTYRQRSETDAQQNNQRTPVYRDNNSNDNTPNQRRVFVNPPRSSQTQTNTRERVQTNNQQTNPAINPRPSNSYESRPATVPQNAPANSNTGSGIRKFRNNR